jgi:uncharacterized metal-binding protein YceD (DUF177 family)
MARPITRSEMPESPYSIRFIQLPPGEHTFGFRLDDTFFHNREGELITRANIEVQAVLTKGGAGAMEINLGFTGTVGVECVRCLEPFRWHIDCSQHLLVRMVEDPAAQDDDVDTVYIAKTAHEVDLAQTLYDFVVLEVPYSPVHPDNLDGSPACETGLPDTDPNEGPDTGNPPADDRWSALKKIKLN